MCRKKKEPPQQTDPPSIPVIELFPSEEFPEGEIQQYREEYVYVLLMYSILHYASDLLQYFGSKQLSRNTSRFDTKLI